MLNSSGSVRAPTKSTWEIQIGKFQQSLKLLFTKVWTGLEGANKDSETPRSQEQWGGIVTPVHKGARKGIRYQNMKRITIRKLPKRSYRLQ